MVACVHGVAWRGVARRGAARRGAARRGAARRGVRVCGLLFFRHLECFQGALEH